MSTDLSIGTTVKISRQKQGQVNLHPEQDLVHNSVMNSYSGHEATVVEILDSETVKLDIDGARMKWPVSCLTAV